MSIFQRRGSWPCSLTLAVVAKGHLGLAETNSVLAGADAIELLKLGLLDILESGSVVSRVFGRVGDEHLARQEKGKF